MLWAVWLADLPETPFPTIADPLRLLIYPLGFTTVLLVSRAQVDSVRTNASLDGLITALGTAALFSAMHGPIEIPVDATAAATLTTFLYPLGDLLIVGVLMAGLSTRSWRVTPTTLALGVGLLALTGGDALHLRDMVAGDYVPGPAAILDLGARSGAACGRAVDPDPRACPRSRRPAGSPRGCRRSSRSGRSASTSSTSSRRSAQPPSPSRRRR